MEVCSFMNTVSLHHFSLTLCALNLFTNFTNTYWVTTLSKISQFCTHETDILVGDADSSLKL